MSSNLRPQLEAEIVVSGEDANGEQMEVRWKSNELQSIKWSRGIDPLGNELPYMELQWTEVVVDGINANLQAVKYQNLISQMSVRLEWQQSMTLTTTWRTIYENNTWADLFTANRTWRDITPVEVISTPMLFLKSKPVIKKNIITWTAVDFLYFANYNERKYYNGAENNTSVKNLTLLMLADLRATYWKNQQIRDIIGYSLSNIEQTELSDDENVIDYDIIMEGALNNNIKDVFASRNLFLDFDNYGALIIGSLKQKNIDFEINNLILKSHPTVTLQNAIGEYKCKEFAIQKNTDKAYELSPSDSFVDSGIEFNRYNYDEDGQTESPYSEINYDIEFKNENVQKVTVTPIKRNSYDYNFVDSALSNADVVSEQNLAMPFKIDHQMPLERLRYLRKFQSNGLALLKAEFLGHPALSVGDRVTIPTNMVDINNEQIIKDGFIKSFIFTYNGASRESIEFNEFRGWS